MAPRLCPYDIGCEPSPSVPAETLLQDGWKTYLLFFAVSKAVGESGHLKDLGVAALECKQCGMSKFGYPNDEGLPEHPLYNYGMADLQSSVHEVIESAWAEEVSQQRIASAQRIWGRRGMDWTWATKRTHRHFIITLKEKTFECLASELSVECFFKTFEEAFAHVVRSFMKR
jgi:hypothetical protein